MATQQLRFTPPSRRRRRRLLPRLLPLVLCAVIAFGFGVHAAGASGRAQHRAVAAYVRAWEHHDYRTMYAMLSPGSRARLSQLRFISELEGASQTATLQSLRPSRSFAVRDGVARVPFVVHTQVFGTVRQVLELPLQGSGSGTTVVFGPSVLFPGLHGDEQLSRTTRLGARGTLLAANGEVLAAGPHRRSPIPAVANQIVGALGSIPADQEARFAALGYPLNAQVGINGLEAIFQTELAGRPGGELLAGTRVLAASNPVPGTTVRTTIVPRLETAVADALGNTYSGMTVIDPHTGAVEAAVGLAFSVLQPPGSTFKIITSAAALQDGFAKLDTVYPYESSVDLDGFTMQNSAGEECGGTLLQSFAQSCDTVFAPLGAQIGGAKLVAMAERFGFNQPTGNSAVVPSTIPSAATIGSPLSVGDSAIGQGLVQATTLEMADVGAAIANGGARPIPTFRYGATPRFVQVVSPKVAAEIQQMMIAVVNEGTGVTAAISGIQVAGKTGTAELANTAGKSNDKKETDAWFVGYAPASGTSAKLVACALFPNAGFGEASAAPAVRQVLLAALEP